MQTILLASYGGGQINQYLSIDFIIALYYFETVAGRTDATLHIIGHNIESDAVACLRIRIIENRHIACFEFAPSPSAVYFKRLMFESRFQIKKPCAHIGFVYQNPVAGQ